MTDSPELDGRWREALDVGQACLLDFDRQTSSVVIVPGTLLGVADGAISYERFLECVHTDDRARVGARILALLDAPLEQPYRDDFRTSSGEWLAVRGKALSPGRIVAVVSAESERRRADEARIRAIQDLSMAARSSEIFTSMLSHDLKNPINVVMATAHTLIEGLPGPQLRGALDRIRSNAERLTRIIGHLRDYARGRPGGLALDREDTDLAHVVDHAVGALDAGQRIERSREGDTRGSWDDARLEHALMTLIDDALGHCPSSSVIRVAMDGRDETVVTLTIAHDGVVPARTVENAFRPFGGDDAEQGLGLFSARQAIVAHGADVTMESSPDTGTRFVVRLPRRLDEVTGSIASAAWDDLLTADAASAGPTSVTATLYGALPLYERAPVAYWKLYERYTALFDDALNRRVYRGEESAVRDETRAIAAALGSLGGGALEVAEIHARALRSRLRGASHGRGQALIAEGRLLAFEVMGHLVTWYRRRSTFSGADRNDTNGGGS